jgi:RNA polymerase sigma-70 factor (ECF subfamily)
VPVAPTTDTATLAGRAGDPDAPLAGRQEAFCALVERYQDAVYGYAYALLGDRHLAQDATQEAWVSAYRHLGDLRAPGAFPGWLRRIVRTHCLRLRRARPPACLPLDALPAQRHPPGGPDPATGVEAGELRAAVRAALAALPAHERSVTMLYYIGDYSQAEIAAFLDLPVNTVKKRLQSSRARLQRGMLGMVRRTLRGDRPSRDAALVEAVRFRTAMAAAAAAAEETLVEQLLVDGADVDARDAEGRTLLSWAAQHGRLETVETLLRLGAAAGAPDGAGRTPLQWARLAGQRAVADLLRRHGATA